MTNRSRCVLLLGVVLAAWASAHGSGGLTADRLRMLHDNRPLLEDLLDRGLIVAEKQSPLERADECLNTTNRLARELRSAVYVSDPDRIAEVSDLLKQVVSDAFVPNLVAARNEVPVASDGYKRMKLIHRQAHTDVTALVEQIPTEGQLGAVTRVQLARERLTAAAADIGPPPADETR
jgi:hypothetical protein